MAIKLDKIFWFNGVINKVLIQPFWWVFLIVIIFYVPFLRVWWWAITPLILAVELRMLYLWWVNWDYSYAKYKWVMLEIVPPKVILVPLKAMDDVFTVMWGPLYGPPSWREEWCEGDLRKGTNWMSWEIASIEGSLHYYIRVPVPYKLSLETILYAHYPELEIHEVSDYTKDVPQNIPNEEWDVYGEDYMLTKPAPYPIKTFEKFFEPQGEKIAAEEKRMDPIASLLELMSKLGPGEQFWMQFITTPITEVEEPDFYEEGREIIAKITNRPIKKAKTLKQDLLDLLHNLILGPQKEGSGEKATYTWVDTQASEENDREMVLSPGEREVLTEVENKLKKPVFRTNIRSVYVAKRENFKTSHKLLHRSYFSHFGTEHLNQMIFSKVTRPKTNYVFRKRIPFIRNRRQFRNFILRFTPLFPDRTSEQAILNPEELATLYHFPIKITGLVAPTMARVESKKGGPPPNLPTE